MEKQQLNVFGDRSPYEMARTNRPKKEKGGETESPDPYHDSEDQEFHENKAADSESNPEPATATCLDSLSLTRP